MWTFDCCVVNALLCVVFKQADGRCWCCHSCCYVVPSKGVIRSMAVCVCMSASLSQKLHVEAFTRKESSELYSVND